MADELSPQVKQEIEEVIDRSEKRFALRKLASLLTFGFLAYKIFTKGKKAGEVEAMSDNQISKAKADS